MSRYLSFSFSFSSLLKMGLVKCEGESRLGRYKERVKEGEYGECILYSCMKIEQ
jgi:hypothetical protein